MIRLLNKLFCFSFDVFMMLMAFLLAALLICIELEIHP